METQFELLKRSRSLTLELVRDLSSDQINRIPNGFRNSIAWNVIHLIVTQRLLCYGLTGLDVGMDEQIVAGYRKGSRPDTPVSPEKFMELLELLTAFPDQLEADYKDGVFERFDSYETSAGVTLTTIEEAIAFNTFHEGIHIGIILQLLKFV